nr:helix-turn-helix domain-containing protein [Rhodoblastus acidophilus]
MGALRKRFSPIVLNHSLGHDRTGRLSCDEAAELLGMSKRHFRRLLDVYEAKGPEGPGGPPPRRASGRRASVDEIAWVVEQLGTRYFNFTAKHFHEAIVGEAMTDGRPFARSHTWTKWVLQLRGLTTKPTRGAPAPANAVHCQACSYFIDPILAPRRTAARSRGELTMDDATSRILSIFLIEEEGTASSFRGLCETIKASSPLIERFQASLMENKIAAAVCVVVFKYAGMREARYSW